MSDATAVLIVMTIGTFALKSAGPLVLGDRALPVRVQQVVDLLPAALLAALWRRLPFVVVIILASAATALTRLIS